MKTLLAIFTCHKYVYTVPGTTARDWFTRPPAVDRVQGVRDSWLKDVTGDYKFFYGTGDPSVRKSDSVFLNAPDDYRRSSEKLRELIRYALDEGYDYLIKVDDDVYVYWDRLIQNMPTADYVGNDRFDFAPGFTYSLSRRSMELLTKSPIGIWAEDRWVGETLRKHRVPYTKEPRFYLVPPTRTNQYISDEDLLKPNEHITIHALSPDQMRRLRCHTQSATQALASAPAPL